MFMLFEFMFPIIFVIVFGMIIFQFVTGIGTWHKNNQSPRLSVSATIVAKRENITPHKLRSTYGTSLYRETGDIYLVAYVLGHNDVIRPENIMLPRRKNADGRRGML